MNSKKSGLDTTGGLKHWPRPEYLDRWGPPPFRAEHYLFHAPMLEKHADALDWAGNQIGFLTLAALDELEAAGVPRGEAIEAMKADLRAFREVEGRKLVQDLGISDDQRDARTIGHLLLRWDAALGLAGEIMVNRPTRFVRRNYEGGALYKYMTPEVLAVMSAEGEGLAAGVNPDFTFRRTRFACGGHAYDEWVVERVDGRDEAPAETASAGSRRDGLKQWRRPAYLDSAPPPPFQIERYLFSASLHKKHYDAMEWSGVQIAYIMRAALRLLSDKLSQGEARLRLMRRLREARRDQTIERLKESLVPAEQRDARFIASYMNLHIEAALGVVGEVMVNTPDLYLRRFYGGEPWDKHLNALILDIMGAEGEGVAEGLNPRYTFRTNRFTCGGDTFDEWTIEPMDMDTVGRSPRIPEEKQN